MNYRIDRPAVLSEGSAKGTLIFAHGAGAGMDSGFMEAMTTALNQFGITVVRFEFPYMQKCRVTGGRRPPDRAPVLLECWRQVYSDMKVRRDLPGPLAIGGKSMGGRMATMIGDQLVLDEMSAHNLMVGAADTLSVVCFGYPFHPPGKLDTMRTDHLEEINSRVLVFQGTRDPMGKPEELESIVLSENISFEWLEDGDHDFKPRVRSGYSQQQHIQTAAMRAAVFISAEHGSYEQ